MAVRAILLGGKSRCFLKSRDRITALRRRKSYVSPFDLARYEYNLTSHNLSTLRGDSLRIVTGDNLPQKLRKPVFDMTKGRQIRVESARPLTTLLS